MTSIAGIKAASIALTVQLVVSFVTFFGSGPAWGQTCVEMLAVPHDIQGQFFESDVPTRSEIERRKVMVTDLGLRWEPVGHEQDRVFQVRPFLNNNGFPRNQISMMVGSLERRYQAKLYSRSRHNQFDFRGGLWFSNADGSVGVTLPVQFYESRERAQWVLERVFENLETRRRIFESGFAIENAEHELPLLSEPGPKWTLKPVGQSPILDWLRKQRNFSRVGIHVEAHGFDGEAETNSISIGLKDSFVLEVFQHEYTHASDWLECVDHFRPEDCARLIKILASSSDTAFDHLGPAYRKSYSCDEVEANLSENAPEYAKQFALAQRSVLIELAMRLKMRNSRLVGASVEPMAGSPGQFIGFKMSLDNGQVVKVKVPYGGVGQKLISPGYHALDDLPVERILKTLRLRLDEVNRLLNGP